MIQYGSEGPGFCKPLPRFKFSLCHVQVAQLVCTLLHLSVSVSTTITKHRGCEDEMSYELKIADKSAFRTVTISQTFVLIIYISWVHGHKWQGTKIGHSVLRVP